MIPAQKGPRFNRWFAKQAEGRVHKTFGRVYVHGLDRLEATARDHPILLVSNHSAWWDSLFIIWLMNRPVQLDGYAMMDAQNLRALPFLGKVGGFGIDLRDPEDGAKAIAYGAALLDRPGRVVLVYPQGREMPLNARPLGFRSGAAAVAHGAPDPSAVRVIPVGARYVFGPREAPDAYISFGPPAPPAATVEAERQRQEAAVIAELDRVEAALLDPKVGGMICLHSRAPSALARFAEATLVRLIRLHQRWTRRRLTGGAGGPDDPR